MRIAFISQCFVPCSTCNVCFFVIDNNFHILFIQSWLLLNFSEDVLGSLRPEVSTVVNAVV